ncbi:hypothetical protein [uncultured Brevundimonas sp.]|uniref:hypothetical protein n=1 Tax=uncultured Brevundimonas sp. TaxID=213418 RepID=UPI0025E329FE|nr:hypothetical protein [uncultured Brevundimonas sp.]
MTRLLKEPTLPAGFEALEPYVEVWARDDFQSRFEARFTSDMDAIREFYDQMQPRADDALRFLESLPLEALPPEAERLFKLLMALAHVAVSVERHGQPGPKGVGWPTTLRVTQGSFPP